MVLFGVAVELLALAAFANAAALPVHSQAATLSSSVAITETASPTKATVEPCALVSSAVEAAATIDPETAYQCLNSAPNKRDPAIELVDSLALYLQFQSDLNYLKAPPSGYLMPAVDIEQGLVDIRAKVEKGVYESEYQFQLDIVSLLGATYDGHLSYAPDLFGLITFSRPIEASLVSISADGIENPEVFAGSDMISINTSSGQVLFEQANQTFTPSPVVLINGVETRQFLVNESLRGKSQDPDALYNLNFFQLAQASGNIPTFQRTLFYPGPSTTFTFANGTSRTYLTLASINGNLPNVTNGEQLYSFVCSPSSAAPTSSSAAATTVSQTSTASAIPSPTVIGYPYPVEKHSQGSVAGYFVSGSGYDDVAVLSILGFEGSSVDTTAFQEEFSNVTTNFLSKAKSAGKTKLIVDLQGNGGGFVNLGADTFSKLFPSISPFALANLRETDAVEIVSKGLSDLIAAEPDQDFILGPLAYQNNIKEDKNNFTSWADFYSPVHGNNGLFTAAFATAGSEDMSVVKPEQPFAAEDIILLYDGYCASTCTTFSEMMKNLAGVKSITVGGRPQTGPMQGLGGVKGSQVFPWSEIRVAAVAALGQLEKDDDSELLSLANPTFGPDYSFLNTTLSRAVSTISPSLNGRNSLRIGDQSQTPLHFVYEAADCRIWWTKEMLTDMEFLWRRVSDITLLTGTDGIFSSEYCIEGSTGHPTSLSGGWKQGTLGPQNPPAGAKLDLPAFTIS